MTDKETNLEFVERMEAAHVVSGAPVMYSRSNMLKILHLAKTTALIEEHKLRPQWSNRNRCWHVEAINGTTFHIAPDLHTAVRAVVDKIKERT